MAEIFLAKMEGPGGFEKLLALKRILPHLSADHEFISMFIDEAKTTSQLTQSNIVHIYEFGEIDNTYYLAMEYVEGKNLRQILARSEELNRPVPVEHAVYIAAKICEGLDYAHRFRDKSGNEALQIIHRDISPQNILVSFEGEVKLTDFGIAKTRAKAGKTKAGILKGKFGYMSPEQALGEPLDQRTDIFSTGIILFEMVTHQRLFASPNELSTLKKIQEAKIPPPSLFNPDISFELEEIILKALEKDKDKRYQTARDFQRDLNRFLNTLNPDFSSSIAAAYIRSLFADEILARKKKMQKIEMGTGERELQKTLTDIDRQKVAAVTPPFSPFPMDMTEKVSYQKMWFQLTLMGLSIVILSLLLLVLNKAPERIIQSTIIRDTEKTLTTPRQPNKESDLDEPSSLKEDLPDFPEAE